MANQIEDGILDTVASFDAGWAAAVKTVSDAVAEDMELLKSDRKPVPWEEWLPRFLVELKRTS